MVAENLCEAKDPVFCGALAPLCLVLITAAVPFRSVAQPAVLAKVGIRELPVQAIERALCRWIGELREGLEEDVALRHAGRPQGGLNEQAPCKAAPFLGVHFPMVSAGANIELLLLISEPKHCGRAGDPYCIKQQHDCPSG